jgi:uncharacterized OB-fold protein
VSAGARIDDRLGGPVFRLDGEVARLLGSLCPACGATAFPRRAVCLECGAEPGAAELSGAGRVHSWTHLANPPFGFDEPLGYACVDLDEGPRVLGALSAVRAAVGERVQAVPAPLRHGALGFRFEVRDA